MIVIKNGTVVNHRGSYPADILIDGGKIKTIKNSIDIGGCEVIDATGCLVFPGFIDAHTHLEMTTALARTADTFESATKAAVMGGTTTVLDFACQNRGDTLNNALDVWFKRAYGVSSCNYGFHMSITDWNAATRREIADMTEAGVTSYKLYMAYPDLRIPDKDIYEILKVVHDEVHGIVGAHCENGDLVEALTEEQLAQGNCGVFAHPLSRPDEVEAEAVNRYLYIADLAGAPVNVVHVSSSLGLNECLRARKRSQKVYIETCPQYLLLDKSRYRLPGFEGAKYVCSPPLRGGESITALWMALENDRIDTVSTDNCSFNFHPQKELGTQDFSKIPNGLPGVQTRASLMYTYGVKKGRITKEQMAKYLSVNAAKLFGMYPQKGAICEGSDADIVVFSPDFMGTIHSNNLLQNVDYNPFEGFPVEGAARDVVLNGEVVVRLGKLLKENRGRYVSRKRSLYL